MTVLQTISDVNSGFLTEIIEAFKKHLLTVTDHLKYFSLGSIYRVILVKTKKIGSQTKQVDSGRVLSFLIMKGLAVILPSTRVAASPVTATSAVRVTALARYITAGTSRKNTRFFRIPSRIFQNKNHIRINPIHPETSGKPAGMTRTLHLDKDAVGRLAAETIMAPSFHLRLFRRVAQAWKGC
ncbi:MAG: hypothetical protein A4E54_01777 [Pelotomaculum sp. PtaB.Bin117]|nr:MAG: hypothetical protein A4E54_01777 [Pelotomaculum sp. PtaB.Bin117]OPY60882.1 MAG: hypothetical protein A4E56_02419 [Pelotomaculum sp. PtaU1.Bin065]